MKIEQIKLKKAQLNRMPEQEMTLLLMLGCYGNEISAILRLASWSVSLSECTHVIEDEARTSQVFFLVRILIGKLAEFRKSLDVFYFGKKLSKKYSPKLSTAANQAISDLCRDMDSNMFKKIRNKIAFHSDDYDLYRDGFCMLPAAPLATILSVCGRWIGLCTGRVGRSGATL